MIQPFCFKSQKYKIACPIFIIVSKSLHLKNKSEILISKRCASRIFPGMLNPQVYLGIYSTLKKGSIIVSKSISWLCVIHVHVIVCMMCQKTEQRVGRKNI